MGDVPAPKTAPPAPTPPRPESELNLYRCDGLQGGEPHWGRQRLRIVNLRWAEDGVIETDTRALCLDHYNELRKGIEPRHAPETG